jgi:NAD(P)-dependent dehydrogenase (short-subunit alcohol dehydrogenase family)
VFERGPTLTQQLHGHVVIVTGGAGLLGSEYVVALSNAGAHAIVADCDRDGAERAAAGASGARAMAIETDVSVADSVGDMVERVMAEFGRIDGLVNNAALDPKFDTANAGRHLDSFEQFPLEAWERSIAVGLTGAFLCTQAVAPTLLARGTGSVVNICSIYGLVGPDQRLYQTDGDDTFPVKPVAYSVTKSALVGFTRYLAAYWGGFGIRVNTLTLGGVWHEHDEGFVRRYSARTPLGRMARRDEYNGALLFMLSEASSYMTGANVVVDGGWTAW